MRNKDSWMIFPEFLDANLSRKQGRRLAVNDAIEAPNLLEMKLAAQLLNYNFNLLKEKSYPRRWWDNNGLLTISKIPSRSKQQILIEISETIRSKVRPAIQKRKEQKKTKKIPSKKAETKGKLIRPIDEKKLDKKKIVRRR